MANNRRKQRKIVKKSVIIAALCCVAGLVICGVTYAISGFNYKNLVSENRQSVSKRYECSTEIKEIEVDVKATSVTIISGNVSAPVISYYEVENDLEFEIKETSGKLIISQKDTDFHFNMISIGDDKIEIVVPHNFKGDIDIDSSSGSVRATSLLLDNLTINSSSGSVTVEDITSDRVSIDSKSGSVKAGDILTDDFTVLSKSGSIKLGDIDADNKIVLSAKSGSIKFDKMAVGESISIENGSGSISGTIDGKKSDFATSVSYGSGSCNLKNTTEGEKSLYVKSGSGSIKIDFTK